MAVQQAAGADPYFPEHGDPRYRVHRYELELDYRPAPNRLAGAARLSAIAGRAQLTEFQLNLGDFRIGRVRVDGRAAHYTHRGGKLRVRPAKALPAGSAFTVDVHYSGNPRPVNSPWGGLGWEELTDGALVASQPVGAPSWYPCNDRPADKAAYQISILQVREALQKQNIEIPGGRVDQGNREMVDVLLAAGEAPDPRDRHLARRKH